MYVLFKEICERKEQKKSYDVPINREHKLANAHVEGSSRDHMETSIAKLQGHHGQVQLKLFGHRTHSPCRN